MTGVYVGLRESAGPLVLVRERAGEERALLGVFDWGAPGDGARALAGAMLRDLGVPATSAMLLAEDFARDVVAGLPAYGFALARERVDGWLAPRRFVPLWVKGQG